MILLVTNVPAGNAGFPVTIDVGELISTGTLRLEIAVDKLRGNINVTF